MNEEDRYPALVVLDSEEYTRALSKAFPDWRRLWYYRLFRFQPRAYCRWGEVVVRRGAERDLRLLAHELGHFYGLDHPPIRSLAYWTDVMGYGWRGSDRYGLLPAARRWLRGLDRA